MADKFNAEGYYDPTAHDALSAIEKEEKAARVFRPLTYICSPYAGDIAANTEAARRYCRFCVEQGCIPIAPHLHSYLLDMMGCPTELFFCLVAILPLWK